TVTSLAAAALRARRSTAVTLGEQVANPNLLKVRWTSASSIVGASMPTPPSRSIGMTTGRISIRTCQTDLSPQVFWLTNLKRKRLAPGRLPAHGGRVRTYKTYHEHTGRGSFLAVAPSHRKIHFEMVYVAPVSKTARSLVRRYCTWKKLL